MRAGMNSPLKNWTGIRPAAERASCVGHRQHVFPLTAGLVS